MRLKSWLNLHCFRVDALGILVLISEYMWDVIVTVVSRIAISIGCIQVSLYVCRSYSHWCSDQDGDGKQQVVIVFFTSFDSIRDIVYATSIKLACPFTQRISFPSRIFRLQIFSYKTKVCRFFCRIISCTLAIVILSRFVSVALVRCT